MQVLAEDARPDARDHLGPRPALWILPGRLEDPGVLLRDGVVELVPDPPRARGSGSVRIRVRHSAVSSSPALLS